MLAHYFLSCSQVLATWLGRHLWAWSPSMTGGHTRATYHDERLRPWWGVAQTWDKLSRLWLIVSCFCFASYARYISSILIRYNFDQNGFTAEIRSFQGLSRISRSLLFFRENGGRLLHRFTANEFVQKGADVSGWDVRVTATRCNLQSQSSAMLNGESICS